MTTELENEFDFTKKIKQTVKIIEQQSYKKLSFLIIGCSALIFGGYVGSNYLISSIKENNNIVQQQKSSLVQEIKQMNESDFNNFLAYITKNVNIYDAKVRYVQEIIVKADKEETRSTISTSHNKALGEYLTKYKTKIAEDITKLTMIKNNVSNNIDVKKQDVDTFFYYLGAYKSKNMITDKDIDNKIHVMIFATRAGNDNYNIKNGVYEKIKEFDNEIQTFTIPTNQQTLTLPKSKM